MKNSVKARPTKYVLVPLAGDQMDANTDGALGAQRLPGLERDLRREGSALLFPSERLPVDHQRASRRNPSSVHLHGVPQLLSMAARPNRRRFHREQEMSDREK